MPYLVRVYHLVTRKLRERGKYVTHYPSSITRPRFAGRRQLVGGFGPVASVFNNTPKIRPKGWEINWHTPQAAVLPRSYPEFLNLRLSAFSL